jgi:hypothetical protein
MLKELTKKRVEEEKNGSTRTDSKGRKVEKTSSGHSQKAAAEEAEEESRARAAASAGGMGGMGGTPGGMRFPLHSHETKNHETFTARKTFTLTS